MKTKRGTYFYIEMAGAYYAGTKPLTTTKEVSVQREWTETEKEKPRYQRHSSSKWGRYSLPAKNGKHVSWHYGRILDKRLPTETKKVSVPTGEYEDVWSEDFTKAKPFRLKKKAEEKAIMLSHGLKEVKATVHFHEGDR